MAVIQIVFILVAVVTIISAGMVVSVRSMVHAALWLVLALLGVAALFALLQVRFFPVVQVLVYIGAIATLIIVAVMLTRQVMQDVGSQLNSNWWLAAFVSVTLFIGMVWALSNWPGMMTTTRAVPPGGEDIVAFGKALTDPAGFVIPFEVASVLLLGALIGAIFLATERKEKQG